MRSKIYCSINHGNLFVSSWRHYYGAWEMYSSTLTWHYRASQLKWIHSEPQLRLFFFDSTNCQQSLRTHFSVFSKETRTRHWTSTARSPRRCTATSTFHVQEKRRVVVPGCTSIQRPGRKLLIRYYHVLAKLLVMFHY